MPFPGQIIIRVDLDAQIIIGIDELDQQGEFQSVLRVDMLAHQVAHVDLHQFLQIVSGQKPVLHQRDISVHP